MKNQERYEILQSLCHAYCHEEARQSTGKDSSVAMIHARGMLQGACMALNLRNVMTKKFYVIKS